MKYAPVFSRIHYPCLFTNQHSEPGKARLLRHVCSHLNALKLHYGFKQLFQYNPYDDYPQFRYEYGKRLLFEGRRVEDVAFTLEYESDTTFIRGFKQRFGCTPKYFQQQHRQAPS